MKIIDVFHPKVIPEPNTGCWLWIGSNNGKGYGEYWDGIRKQYAHRVSYETHRGLIPDGLVIDHLCQQPYCVNPDHLEPVTHLVNIQRAALRISKCIHGHELSGDNLICLTGKRSSNRRCRTCHADRMRRYSSRSKDSAGTT